MNQEEAYKRYLELYGLTTKIRGVITHDDFIAAHAELCERKAVNIWLGPLLILGPGKWYTRILSRIAFWLLEKAKWELVSSKKTFI